jgi:hypothetical protein
MGLSTHGDEIDNSKCIIKATRFDNIDLSNKQAMPSQGYSQNSKPCVKTKQQKAAESSAKKQQNKDGVSER